MRRSVKTIGLGLALLAASSLVASAKPAHKKKHRWVSSYGQHYSGKSHCGQRSYSVSVGNPAFRNRLALWPRPCGL